MSFALKLKELRETNGLTQKDLAKRLNVSVSSVGMWESTSQVPTAKKLVEIATLFNVSVDTLLDASTITPKERSAGASATKKISITPIEDEMLYAFREVGKRHGENVQRKLIDLAEVLADK